MPMLLLHIEDPSPSLFPSPQSSPALDLLCDWWRPWPTFGSAMQRSLFRRRKCFSHPHAWLV